MRHHTLPTVICLALTALTCACTTTTTTTTAPAGNSMKISAPAKSKQPPASPGTSLEDADAANSAATKQVIAVEQAFAKTMADRNFQAFVSFLSPEAVFFSGTRVYRGSAAVADDWQQYFVGSKAPFNWRPDHVEVLVSGKLALSTGPVYQDHAVVGRFSSIWRLDAPNTWHIVFDKGEAVCGTVP
jgi:ketosteroid isomerase-like protein